MDASTNSRFAPACAASFATLGLRQYEKNHNRRTDTQNVWTGVDSSRAA